MGNDSGDVVVGSVFLKARADFGIVDKGAYTDGMHVSMLWIGGDERMADAIVGSEHGG